MEDIWDMLHAKMSKIKQREKEEMSQLEILQWYL